MLDNHLRAELEKFFLWPLPKISECFNLSAVDEFFANLIRKSHMMSAPESSVLEVLVRRATEKCSREDCRITHNGAQSSLANMSQCYDRNGQKVSLPPARTMHSFVCTSCGQSLQVQQ